LLPATSCLIFGIKSPATSNKSTDAFNDLLVAGNKSTTSDDKKIDRFDKLPEFEHVQFLATGCSVEQRGIRGCLVDFLPQC
jgi:hypothetical protein